MRPNKHQTVRGAGWLLVLGIGLGVGAGGAVARHELEWAFAWWESMRAMVGILRCRSAGVPITNYGLTIAYSLGIFQRALSPFPAALDLYRNLTAETG